MFDLMRLGLPSIEDAHGKKWLCVYQVSSDGHNTWYLAIDEEGRGKPPQPCFLIAVPKPRASNVG